jgi:hypothetical protein
MGHLARRLTSAFDTTTGQAGDQVALGPYEEYEHRNCDQYRGCCQPSPVNPERKDETLEANRQCQAAIIGQEGACEHKFVPGVHEIEERHHRDARYRQRCNDAPSPDEDLQNTHYSDRFDVAMGDRPLSAGDSESSAMTCSGSTCKPDCRIFNNPASWSS